MKYFYAVIASFSLLNGCGKITQPNTCGKTGTMQTLCGIPAPEDLAILPDKKGLIISHYNHSTGPGSVSLLELSTNHSLPLYPSIESKLKANDWGDENCVDEPREKLSPHGIDLSVRADGALQLLVVNHGGRESIEFFEIIADKNVVHTKAQWRGCVIMPKGSALNDVVGLPDGGFLTTQMIGIDDMALDPLESTGFVWQWDPASGITVMPGSHSLLPNGIALSPDGEVVYLNSSFEDRVLKIARHSGKILGTANVRKPDNSAWNPDGKLLVASLDPKDTQQITSCINTRIGSCGMAFEILELDPETMATTIVFQHDGKTLGAGSVAVEVDDTLYIGSFSGDRLLKILTNSDSNNGD